MKKSKIGPLEVSNICLGGNVFGWTIDEAASFPILDAFLEAGGNFIDTADVYSRWVPGHQGGESESILGRWIQQRKNRDKIVLATKVGMDMGEGRQGLSKKHILASIDGSLQRLRTDHVDLYISHKEDPSTPIEETLEAYQTLIRQGKVRAIGASNYSPHGLNSALLTSRKLNLPSYQSLQPLYNLYDRGDFEKELLSVCREHRLAVTPYYALASGFLTGKYRSAEDVAKSPRGSGVAKRYLNERGLRLLSALDEVAAETNSAPAAVALAWLLRKDTVASPIASATSEEQLHLLKVASELLLTKTQMDSLDQASEWK